MSKLHPSVAVLALALAVGCEVNPDDSTEMTPEQRQQANQAIAAAQNQTTDQTQTATQTTTAETVVAEEGAANQVPADFAGVVWLYENVSGWAQTSSLSVSFSGGYINLNYDKARVWPAVNGSNANPWVFVFRDGKWYAATFEWLRFGQTSKPMFTVRGDHIKKSPLNNFQPVSGEVYGFMVSGLARDSSTRNVRERTNVVMKRWP